MLLYTISASAYINATCFYYTIYSLPQYLNTFTIIYYNMKETGEHKAAERLYKFLCTTAMRAGILDLYVGIAAVQNGSLLVISKDGLYQLPSGKLRDREGMTRAIRRIARMHGIYQAHIKRYLGPWDEPGIDGKKARGFGFEIDGKTDKKGALWVFLGKLPTLPLDPGTRMALQKLLNK